MAKKASVVIATPAREAEITLNLVDSRPESEWTTLEEQATAVSGILTADMIDTQTLKLAVAPTHTGNSKLEKLVETVLKALDLEQRGKTARRVS